MGTLLPRLMDGRDPKDLSFLFFPSSPYLILLVMRGSVHSLPPFL